MTMLMWQSKDVERTVGINCRYLGALQTSQLSKQDRLFLIEVSLLYFATRLLKRCSKVVKIVEKDPVR